MSVRAKFQLVSIEEHAFGGKTLKFSAQYDDRIPEDRRFMKATPWGEFSMCVDNPDALKQFENGKFYYLDMAPCEG
jgi:hypothetical protein